MAAIFSGLSVAWFHHGRGAAVALVLAVLFSTLCAIVAFALSYRAIAKRLGKAKPVLGAFRGSLIATSTFVIAVLVHTAAFPGNGGFLTSIVPVLVIGFGTLGWLVAAIGAAVGAFCERHYFA
jgi:hypothetical protein